MTLVSATIDQLVDQLADADHNMRALAVGELVRRGRVATSALLPALVHADAEVRVLAAEALGEIADPAAAGTFAHMLDDDDGRIRARGAQGLAGAGHSSALDALVRTIDDCPDLEHFPRTLSTEILVARGRPALTAVAPLLAAPAAVTRQRAFLVILELIERLHGAAEATARVRELGDPRVGGADADESAARWRAWIDREHGSGETP